ncbi:hypothetical protein EC968_003194 [Mortierella alpina]|nr:hypothetical protein EC968_003194 [Mortierella alpina]
MSYQSHLAFLLCIAALLSFTSFCDAHVGFLRPCARGSPRAGCPPVSNGQEIDYDLNAPIGSYGKVDRPLCRTTIPSATRPVYKAGQSIETTYMVGASHNGGHCQWALSYDDGETWVVIKTVIRTCLRGAKANANYTVPIPKGAPSGKAVFMWLWNNASGVRELYSNCADIEIQGQADGKLTGLIPLIANYGNNSLHIPEFPTEKQEDKHEAFEKRKEITIIGRKSRKTGARRMRSTEP